MIIQVSQARAEFPLTRVLKASPLADEATCVDGSAVLEWLTAEDERVPALILLAGPRREGLGPIYVYLGGHH